MAEVINDESFEILARYRERELREVYMKAFHKHLAVVVAVALTALGLTVIASDEEEDTSNSTRWVYDFEDDQCLGRLMVFSSLEGLLDFNG